MACAMMGARYPSFHVDITPIQLDIIVPFNPGSPSPYERWTQFLHSMDYRPHLSKPDFGPYTGSIEKAELYYHPVNLYIHQIRQSDTHLLFPIQITNHIICLLCSESASVLKVVLHSPSTSMFKILTATQLYNFYPTLTAKHVALTIPKGFDNCPALVYSFGMRSYPANSPLYRDCVRSCPIKIRCTRFLKDVTKSTW